MRREHAMQSGPPAKIVLTLVALGLGVLACLWGEGMKDGQLGRVPALLSVGWAVSLLLMRPCEPAKSRAMFIASVFGAFWLVVGLWWIVHCVVMAWPVGREGFVTWLTAAAPGWDVLLIAGASALCSALAMDACSSPVERGRVGV